ncbi:hypothetical protein EDB85DRAFT_1884997 [Lactarius pseudohatsudake]|nr:hypothetical protein EDB85DRAFT_1884997 [Lactarius pseudohatsudake]
MVGILSIPDEEAFGLDLTRVEKVYRLNNRNYEIVRKIHERNSIRGHSTVVYSLKVRITGTRNTPARLRSRKLKLVGGLSQLPEMMTEERPSEGTFFSGFFGQFGIVDVVGYHICTSNESFGCTAHYFSNARHYNLFLGGVLHRDISSGNILRLREPTDALATPRICSLRHMLGEDVNLGLCRGSVIDGDHAIEWDENARAPSPERSGTLPFMTMHLLQRWSMGHPALQCLHTAVDDLEFFLWVLVWSLVHILKKSNNENSSIHRIGHTFSSSQILEVLTREHKIKYWKDLVFGDLIQEWVKFSANSRDFVLHLEDLFRISTPRKGFRMNLTSASEKFTRNSFKPGTITLEKLGISLTGMRLVFDIPTKELGATWSLDARKGQLG